ncbi:MAG: hypothetical protein M3Q39_01315 [Actinomycetota bacterium]|nr:hypothetical protein [Actinomycetota bacterium]
MHHLMSDMVAFRLAPTVARELATALGNTVLVIAIVLLLVDERWLQICGPVAAVCYGAVRIGLVTHRRSATARSATADQPPHARR